MLKIINILIFLVTNIIANNLSINDVEFSYKLNENTDYLYIKQGVQTTIIKQNSLWNNAHIELNLLSANDNQIKLIMMYRGNRELGYIYTFVFNTNKIELKQVSLYQLEENQICDMDIKILIENRVEMIETSKCRTLEQLTINTSELKFAAKHYKLKNILTQTEIKMLFIEQQLTIKTLLIYNDIAYYLQKSGANKESAYILEKILEKFPNRTVAYLNLGDAYWGLEDKVKAQKAYQTYIKQMKENGKEKKIPKVVLERVQ